MGNGSNGVVVDTAPVFVTAPDCHISHFIASGGDGGARDLLRQRGRALQVRERALRVT